MSTSANLPPWQRKESVTIIERDEKEDEPDIPFKKQEMTLPRPEMEPVTSLAAFRRASSAEEHSGEDQFLTVPKSITASSSAETLTGKCS